MSQENKRVLIADDDPIVRHLLSSMLEMQDYQVSFAETGKGCIENLNNMLEQDQSPVVIFLDLHFGDLSGAEVLKQIRVLTTDLGGIPVIMLSANSKEEMVEFHPDCNPDYYLEKPFGPDVVHKVMAEVEEKR